MSLTGCTNDTPSSANDSTDGDSDDRIDDETGDGVSGGDGADGEIGTDRGDDDPDGNGALIEPIAAEPRLPDVIETGDEAVQGAETDISYFDVDGLQPHESAWDRLSVGHLATHLHLRDGAEQQWIRRLSEAVRTTHDLEFEDGTARLTGFVMTGDIEPDEFTTDAELPGSPAETYRDYDLYLEQPSEPIGVTSGAIVGVETVELEGSARTVSGGGVSEAERLLLRSYVDRLTEEASPAEWVREGLRAVRPIQYGASKYGSPLRFSDGADLWTRGADVHGDETTYRDVRAAPTAAQFEETWSPEPLEEQLESDYDSDFEYKSENRVGILETTMSTEKFLRRW